MTITSRDAFCSMTALVLLAVCLDACSGADETGASMTDDALKQNCTCVSGTTPKRQCEEWAERSCADAGAPPPSVSDAGAQPPPDAASADAGASGLVTDLQVLDLVAADLAKQSDTSRAYFRYFTLEAWGNLGAQIPSVSADVERAALIKMINLLSTGPAIVQPVAIDANRFIYRVDMRKLKWTSSAWTNIKNTDPYLAPSAFPSRYTAAAQQTIRADWFVSNIPNSSVNAYFVFLGINSDDPTIDKLNGVNRFADMTTGAPATVRAGQAVSGTEAHNRILSWHQTTAFGSGTAGAGDLFKSYNFDSDVGDMDIFSHPYKPTTNDPNTPGAYDFSFADSDNMFTLPNGLFGYYTTIGAAQGHVQNQDNAGAPFPGPTFCFQCHDNQTNMIAVHDDVNAAIRAAPSSAFPSTLRMLLLGMYDNAAITAKTSAAGARFAAAYKQLNLPITETPGIATESLNMVTNTYSVILSVGTAAAEMGVTSQQLLTGIKSSTSLALALGSLATKDTAGNPNGFIRRDTWETSYAALRAALFPTLPQP